MLSEGEDSQVIKVVVLVLAAIVAVYVGARVVSGTRENQSDTSTYAASCKSLKDLSGMSSYAATVRPDIGSLDETEGAAVTAGLADGITPETVDPDIRPAYQTYYDYIHPLVNDEKTTNVTVADAKAAAAKVDVFVSTCKGEGS